MGRHFLEDNQVRALSDRATINTVLMLLALLANLIALFTLVPSRAEYAEKMRSVDARLSGIEQRLGIYRPPERVAE